MTNISPWLIYWLMQLDSICEFVRVVAIIGSALLIGLIAIRIMCIYASEYDSDAKAFYNYTTKLYKFGSIIIPIFILINVFIPNTKTVASMIIIPPIINNEQVQQLPNDVLIFIHSIIEEYSLNKKEKK